MRTGKLIDYLYDIVDTLVSNTDYQIKADFLENDVNSYSVDKIPTASVEQVFITGTRIKQDVYSFRSRFKYTSDQAEQLKNIGFFELFENIIWNKNKNKELPDIDGIQSIECLNCGSLMYVNDNTCEMDIQIRVTYMEV